MKIITLTLNPAFDLHFEADGFRPYGESVARLTDRCAGGKGVNISRALAENGVESEAVIFLGEENGAEFKKCLENEQIRYTGIDFPGRIRENMTLHTKGMPETRISLEGFSADGRGLSEVLRTVEASADSDTVVTFTGSLPRGISHGEAVDLLLRLRALGVRLVLDSKALDRDDIIMIKPWLIKPNGEEVAAYIDGKIAVPEDALDGATALARSGVENVMVTLGGEGALLVTRDSAMVARPPSITPLSTVGAGDSAIAGFIAAVARGDGDAARLCESVAYGTAACLTRGTNPPTPDEIARIRDAIEIRKIK